jgi:hypothetical protein
LRLGHTFLHDELHVLAQTLIPIAPKNREVLLSKLEVSTRFALNL